MIQYYIIMMSTESGAVELNTSCKAPILNGEDIGLLVPPSFQYQD